MFSAFLTLVLTLGAPAGLAFLAGWGLAAHVRSHPEALKVITAHVILPLLAKPPQEQPLAEDDAAPPPDP